MGQLARFEIAALWNMSEGITVKSSDLLVLAKGSLDNRETHFRGGTENICWKKVLDQVENPFRLLL